MAPLPLFIKREVISTIKSILEFQFTKFRNSKQVFLQVALNHFKSTFKNKLNNVHRVIGFYRNQANYMVPMMKKDSFVSPENITPMFHVKI